MGERQIQTDVMAHKMHLITSHYSGEVKWKRESGLLWIHRAGGPRVCGRFFKGQREMQRAEFTSQRRQEMHVQTRKASPDRGPEMSSTLGTAGMSRR